MKTTVFAVFALVSSVSASANAPATVTIDMDGSPRLTEKLARACAEAPRDAVFGEVCKEFHVQVAQLTQFQVDRPEGFTSQRKVCLPRLNCAACSGNRQACELVDSCTGQPLEGTGFTQDCPGNVQRLPSVLDPPKPNVDPAPPYGQEQRRPQFDLQRAPRGLPGGGLPNFR